MKRDRKSDETGRLSRIQEQLKTHAANQLELPTRALLADALRRLMAAGIPLEGASDHGVSEALYLRDPDDNGIELYWDRPKEKWPRTADGSLAMVTRRLDLQNLLGELDKSPA